MEIIYNNADYISVVQDHAIVHVRRLPRADGQGTDVKMILGRDVTLLVGEPVEPSEFVKRLIEPVQMANYIAGVMARGTSDAHLRDLATGKRKPKIKYYLDLG